MSKHTPGPYEAKEGGFIYAEVNDDPNWCIGKAYHAPSMGGASASALESNAKLFAASWDLLAACEAWLDHRSDVFDAQIRGKLDSIPTGRIDEISAQMKAAIAKASAP